MIFAQKENKKYHDIGRFKFFALSGFRFDDSLKNQWWKKFLYSICKYKL